MKRKLQLLTAFVVFLFLVQTTTGYTSSPIKSVSAEQFKPIQIAAPAVIPVIIDTFPTDKPSIPVTRFVPEQKVKVIVKKTTSRASRAEVKAYVRAKIGEKQFNCISKLWTSESGWRWNAYNESSGAYGIPQALPGKKMANVKNNGGPDWRTNPITQVNWGMNYVKVRYGSACGAWEYKKRVGWY